jgi:serine phosphatase RsbU (regulator of sigma subunit)
MAVLHIYPEAGAPWKAALDAERVSIGRGQANDIVIPDTHCSSCHAFIERAGEGFVIRDAASKNGTFLNGRLVENPMVLSPGDEIGIGSATLVFDRPRMPRVKFTDSAASATDASTAFPFRTILEQAPATDIKTSPLAGVGGFPEANRILQIMIHVSETLVAHKPLGELLEDILDLIAGHLPMDQCVLMLRADGAERLETRTARILGERHRGEEIEVSRTIVAMAYEQHLAVLLADPAADPRVLDGASIFSKNIRSALCVPIGDAEEVIGVLYADRHGQAEPFKEADLRLLTLLASTAAVKIQQARQIAALIQAEKVQRELKIAADIQRDLLPRTLPPCEGYGISALALPCLQVGGDYYDLVSLGPGRIGLAVADVSGKGIGAALLMASLRAWLRAELLRGTDLAGTAARLNDFIHESSDSRSFITFFFAALERETGALQFVNAGHNPPLILGRDGLVRELPATGLALGMLAGRSYEVGLAEVGPGEVLVLYTDGITEGRNPGGEEFGVDGLAGIVRREREKDAAAIQDAVFRGLAEFTACAEPFDDRTLVIVKREVFESARPL